MKTICIIFCLSLGFANAQSFVESTPTFLGKTRLQIQELNAQFGNLKANDLSGEDAANELNYVDAAGQFSYFFSFRDDSCVSFVVFTQNDEARQKLIQAIEKKCQSRINEHEQLQVIDGKNYYWKENRLKNTCIIANAGKRF